MSFAGALSGPFYSGSGISSLVPDLFDVAVNGRPYLIDWRYAKDGGLSRESIKLLKPQQDSSERFSERSLNPEEFARASQETWYKGAGQVFADRNDSDAARFRSSKGIDVWTRWQMSLLYDTYSITSSANTNLQIDVAGSYLYESDANQVYHRTTFGGPRTSADIQAGEGAQSVKSFCTDGYTVYAALGSNGIHTTTRGATSSAHYSALSCTLVAYVKGRLMAANGNAIYNVIASGAAPSALFTHPNTDFTWVGFAEGLGQVFAAGYSGDKSLVYKTAVKADGTALDTPTVAGQLPDGEIVRAIYGYLGYVLLGTDQGVRFAIADTNGNLTIGALIDINASVRCFEGQGSSVWFGWTNYDSSSTGLGRLNLETLNGSAPAYASDLMVTGQGTVLSVATFGDKRVIAVSGLGVYAEDTNLVASGTFHTGFITYGLPDNKIAMYADVRHQPLDGTVAVGMATDEGTTVTLGTNSTADTTSLTVGAGESTGETFELELTLTRKSGDHTAGPVVTRLTLEANPAPGRGLFFTIPLLLHEQLKLANNSDWFLDPQEEASALVGMESAGSPVTLQWGDVTESVLLDDHNLMLESYTRRRDGFNGTFIARFRRPRLRSTS